MSYDEWNTRMIVVDKTRRYRITRHPTVHGVRFRGRERADRRAARAANAGGQKLYLVRAVR